MREFVDILSDVIERDPELTASALAIKAGLDNSTIRLMIKKRRSPRIDTAFKICRALGTTVEAFLAENAEAPLSELQILLEELPPDDLEVLKDVANGMLSRLDK